MRNSIYCSFLLCILLLWGSVVYADCTAGSILIGISKGGFKRFFDVTFLTYCVTFPNAEVSLLSTQEIPRPDDHPDLASLPFYKQGRKQQENNTEDMLQKNQWLVGLLKYEHNYSYLFNFSGNGNYVAFSRDIYSDEGKKSLSVYEVSSRKEITTIATRKRIERTAWSPDNNYIAVLTKTSKFGLWPHELLFMVAGHPVPYNTFYLDIYDLTGKPILTEKLIGKNLKCGSGDVLWKKDTFSSHAETENRN